MSQTIELTPMQEQPDVPMRTSDTQEQFNVNTQNWMGVWKDNVTIWNNNLPALNTGLNAAVAVVYALPDISAVVPELAHIAAVAEVASGVAVVAEHTESIDVCAADIAAIQAAPGYAAAAQAAAGSVNLPVPTASDDGSALVWNHVGNTWDVTPTSAEPKPGALIKADDGGRIDGRFIDGVAGRFELECPSVLKEGENTAGVMAFANDRAFPESVTLTLDTQSQLRKVAFTSESINYGSVYKVVKCGNVLIAPGSAKKVYVSSSDGVTWSEITIPAASFANPDLYDAAYDESTGNIIVIGKTKHIVLSTNGGVSWSRIQGSSTGSDLGSVACGEGVFVAPYYNTGTYARSTNNGQSFSGLSLSSLSDARGVVYGNGKFVIYGISGGYAVSTNGGASFTYKGTLGTTLSRFSFFVDGKFWLGSTSGALWSSPDGENWTPVPTGFSNEVVGLFLYDSRLLGLGYDGTVCIYSESSSSFNRVDNVSGGYVAGLVLDSAPRLFGGSRVTMSVVPVSEAFPKTVVITDRGYACRMAEGGDFSDLIIGSNGILQAAGMVSSDAKMWGYRNSSTVFAEKPEFTALGYAWTYSEKTVYRKAPEENWVAAYTSSQNIIKIKLVNERLFVLSSSFLTLAHTADGTTWSSVSITGNYPFDITYGGSVYVISCASARIATSTDLATWAYQTLSDFQTTSGSTTTSHTIDTAEYANNMFLLHSSALRKAVFLTSSLSSSASQTGVDIAALCGELFVLGCSSYASTTSTGNYTLYLTPDGTAFQTFAFAVSAETGTQYHTFTDIAFDGRKIFVSGKHILFVLTPAYVAGKVLLGSYLLPASASSVNFTLTATYTNNLGETLTETRQLTMEA